MNNFEIVIPTKLHQKQIENIFDLAISNNFKQENLVELFPGELLTLIEEQKKYLNRFYETNGLEEKFWAASLGDRIVGVIAYGTVNQLIHTHLGKKPPRYEIKSTYILPEYQRQGIGKELFKRVIKELKGHKIERACLDCGYKNKIA